MPRPQLDIEGLCIAVTPADKATAAARAGKSKARSSQGVEILSGADLRLKEGRRYALVGRNGTGKSSE